MRILHVLIVVIISACNDKNDTDHFVQNDWQIVDIIDSKNKPGSPMSLNYRYRANDSLKALLYFLNDTSYVVKDLFERTTDTNYFQIHGDTLITNREPRDYLVIAKGENDSVFLINKTEQLVFTLIKSK